MSRQPAATVIIPAYNAERFLGEALDSVLAQTLPADRLEVIVVDDGSTDGTLAIAEQYPARHPNLRVFSIPNSGSAARPRNVGLEHATGTYLFFLDADDVLDPDALRAMVDMAEETGSGVVLCKMGSLGDRPIPRAMFTKTRRRADVVSSAAYHTLGPWKLFRRSIVEEHGLRFAEGFRLGEDRPFVMSAYLHSPHVSILADRVYYWLRARDDGGNTTTAGQSPRAHLEANLALAEVVVDATVPGERREVLLARPIMGPGGLRATFGRSFREMTEPDQVAAIDRARAFVAPIWTPGLRGRGTAETQILLELVLAGDRRALLQASDTLASRQPLPLTVDGEGFAFVQGGARIPSLKAQLGGKLVDLSIGADAVTISGTVWADGVTATPDAVSLVWVHRRTKRAVRVAAEPREPAATAGDRTRFDVVTSLATLRTRDRWDAFLEARWGSAVLRERFGRMRSEDIDRRTVEFGERRRAALTFTEHGNLTLDIGPVHRYHDAAPLKPVQVGDRVTVARRLVVTLLGDIRPAVRARFEPLGRGKALAAELRPVSDTVTVIVAAAPARKGTYRLLLTASGGPVVASAEVTV